MSQGHEGRDSENNWVIPSAESLAVEKVGAVQGGEEEAAASGSEAAPPPDNQETTQLPDVKPPSTEPSEGPKPQEELLTVEPEKPDEESGPPPDTEGPRGPGTLGGDLEEVSCSSSEDDVEGLRKRVGRGAPPVSVGPGFREAAQQDADAGSSSNLSTLVIAAVGLLCIGILVFSGGSFISDDDSTQTVVSRSMKVGDGQPPQIISDIQAWITQHADQFTGDPSSLQVMSGLLDKVAKENQEIRHMQAKLQAQKEDLETLLSVSDGEKVTPGPPHTRLTEENVRLKDALLKEETAHLSAKEELQNVQEKLEALEGSHVDKEALVVENSQLKVDLDSFRKQIEGFLAQKETLVAESQMLRQELDKQRLLVATIRQDLENLVAKTTEAEDEKLLQERLSEVSNRLAMEAQRSETWEKTYVEHAQRRKEQVGELRRDHGHKEWKKPDKYSKTSDTSTPGGDPRKAHHKQGKEHSKRWTEESQPETQHEEWRSKKHEDKHWKDRKQRHWEGEKAGAEIPEEKDHWKNKAREHRSKDSAVHHRHDSPERQGRHHQGEEAREGFHPRKGQKEFTDSHKRRDDSEKGKDHRHHDHNKFWKKLSDHQYRVPLGCSGLEDCARKDGMDLFSVDLKPVERAHFEKVLLNYLAKTQLSEHLPELMPLLDGFFEGPHFSHHKIRFKDFVDDVEDFLEDLARKETGNDDIVDDFERYVYTSFFGEAATKKRYAKKDEQHKTNKYQKPAGKLEKTYDQGFNYSYDRLPIDNITRTAHHVDSHDFKPMKQHKPWSVETHYKEESDHKHNDKKSGSFHNHGGHSEKSKYSYAKPDERPAGHHHSGHHFHKEYQEDWKKQNQGKHNHNPNIPGHENTYKKSFKESDKYKCKNSDKQKEDANYEHYLKKREKDTNNKRYQSSQRHNDQKSWTDGDHIQPDLHKNHQGPIQHYSPKAHHQREDKEGRDRDHHHKHGKSKGDPRNYHQKYGKDQHGNYSEKNKQAKDSDGHYQHKYDTHHQKHGDATDGDYHHKYNNDHHKYDRDRDYHHKHGEANDGDYHHKYNKDHHKHGDANDGDKDHHKYNKDYYKHGDPRDGYYHHKYKEGKDKHGDGRDGDHHNKYDKDHHKHDRDGDYHHKYDKDHHKHDRDGDYHHKYKEGKDKLKDHRDGDYHYKYDKDHHKHGDHHKYKKGKDKHGNDKHEEERRQRDYPHHEQDDHHNAPRQY
ncbi:pre-B-cell leukemia transcription factor-interacting protein 1 isoform X2 [Dendropsophus ebraccatus]|uniref:pre-B-cell leukemia transcription factor-interacting protein 1 isoform X2 n=1 Tax=Dendropsophus ebraccatus TaxID=150705 RepID=UPI00383183A3